MVAVSPEIDDDDLRIREGLLDETLDFSSVHCHRETLQRSVEAAMQAPNQLAKHPPRPRGWAAAIETPGPQSNLQDFVAKRRANRCQVSDMRDAACWGCDLFADNLPSTSDFVGISCFPRAARLLLSRTEP